MIFIVCALAAEAKPLIETMSLRKDTRSCPYETFFAEDSSVVLALSGMGTVAAASATTYLLTRFGFRKEKDFLLNFGSCAGKEEGLFLINKITDEATGRSFYPDMIYDLSSFGLPFSSEKALVTVSKVVDSLSDPNLLYEMEASAIFQAGARFVPPHRILFIKYVSDSGTDDPKKITAALLTSRARKYTSTVLAVLNHLGDVSEPEINIDEELFISTALALRLSETMRCELRQFFAYAQAADIDMEKILFGLHDEGRIPVRSKREGKEVLDVIRERLI
ncbi:MAG: hypothetical protein J5379_02720 [Clostridiales bacterium]|nr:hypothetical protein [Clostridiales bacterium]